MGKNKQHIFTFILLGINILILINMLSTTPPALEYLNKLFIFLSGAVLIIEIIYISIASFTFKAYNNNKLERQFSKYIESLLKENSKLFGKKILYIALNIFTICLIFGLIISAVFLQSVFFTIVCSWLGLSFFTCYYNYHKVMQDYKGNNPEIAE
jgi:hypothetical protein